MNNNDILNELSTNFIEYAVAVNTDRAIPDATSGLKPVARRILWGAFESGYLYSKPHVKSAKIVGDVMGTYHPHGDSSIYGALVRLSQSWVMRYPLIDWHGSNGNIDGDGPAHMRYTEARLSRLANYSEDAEEPVTLPAIFPNLLCNPNTGIGVAMACNWAPHNLKEVAQAIYDYIDGKEPMLPGPDFPTGGIIINKNDIPAIMATGHGSVKVRAKYKVEGQNIVFYEIPYGESVEALMTEIGEVCDGKDVEGVKDIRNESNKKGLRIVIECEKGISPDAIANKLFLKTNLQNSFSYNQVALIDKTPVELNLKQCIKVYLEHNLHCLAKECEFDLTKAKARLEIVDGLLIALEDIDNIITKIKKSDSAAAAKMTLMTDYKMSEAQAKAVLDMKLARLAKLEKVEVENEKKELVEKINTLQEILKNEDKQINIIRERLENIVKKYGDARRTELMQIDIPKEDKEIVAVVPEDVVVMISQTGDIKRIPKTSFRTQRRNGKGVKTEDDATLATIRTNTIDNLLLFTNKGKMYKILVDKLPVGTNVSKGTNIANLIKIEPDEKVISITSLARENQAKYVVFITKQGLFKKTLLEEYTKTKRGTGIAAISLKDGDSLANIELMNEEDMIIITKQGQSIHFGTKEIAAIGRVTAGVKAIKLADGDEVLVGLPVRDINEKVSVFTEGGYGKKIAISEFPLQARGGKGVLVFKETPTSGLIAGAAMINNEDVILLIGKNSICISATDIPSLGRQSTGNIMIQTQVKNIVKI